MKIFLCVLAMICAVCVRAADEHPKQDFDADVQQMPKTSCFAFGPVGIAGITSQAEAAFGRLAKKKDAARLFATVFQFGGVHARCYALIALREVSPDLFKAAISAARKSPPREIEMMSGCLISHHQSGQVFDAIEKGAFAEHFKRHAPKG